MAAPTPERPVLHVVSSSATPVAEADALAELQANPAALVNAAELARAWGWSRAKVSRRLKSWTSAGLLPPRQPSRRGGKRTAARPADAAPPANLPVVPAAIDVAANPGPSVDPRPASEADRPAADTVTAGERGARVRGAAVVRGLSAGVLLAAGIAMAWFGVRINAWYGQSLGRSAEASMLLAGLSISADVLALLLPAAARTLWLDRHRAAAVTAWALWFVTIASALLATVGFAAVNISDTTAARDRVAAENGNLAARIERLRSERASITETRAVSAIEAELQRAQPGAAAVWKATSGCTDVTRAISGEVCAPVLRLREALGTAERRDALDRDLREAEARLGALPPVMAADPQAETAARLARWLSAGHLALAPDDIRMARVFGMTLLPQIAGLVFMLALALFQPGRRRVLRAVGPLRFRFWRGAGA